ncbi:MAG: hypothetical protein PHD01_06905 [Geobacteraceae bacterium]|nr:hypothetical protein [Geobacteraceae bacterium]
MKFFIYLLSLLAVVDANGVRADIYRYVSKEGVECYTDAPVHRNSVLVIREHRKIKSGGLKSNKSASPKVRRNNPVLQSNSISSKPKSLVLPVEGVIS